MFAMTIALTFAALAFLSIITGFSLSYFTPKVEAAVDASLVISATLTAASLMAFLVGAFTL